VLKWQALHVSLSRGAIHCSVFLLHPRGSRSRYRRCRVVAMLPRRSQHPRCRLCRLCRLCRCAARQPPPRRRSCDRPRCLQPCCLQPLCLQPRCSQSRIPPAVALPPHCSRRSHSESATIDGGMREGRTRGWRARLETAQCTSAFGPPVLCSFEHRGGPPMGRWWIRTIRPIRRPCAFVTRLRVRQVAPCRPAS
jgi:hypothetical protein